MNEMEKLQYVLFERLHRRAPGIDKLDRLWDAAVLLPFAPLWVPSGVVWSTPLKLAAPATIPLVTAPEKVTVICPVVPVGGSVGLR